MVLRVCVCKVSSLFVRLEGLIPARVEIAIRIWPGGLTLIYSSNLCDVRTTGKKTRRILEYGRPIIQTIRDRMTQIAFHFLPPMRNSRSGGAACCVRRSDEPQSSAQKPLFRFNYSSSRAVGRNEAEKRAPVNLRVSSGEREVGALPYHCARQEN